MFIINLINELSAIWFIFWSMHYISSLPDLQRYPWNIVEDIVIFLGLKLSNSEFFSFIRNAQDTFDVKPQLKIISFPKF